MISDFVRVTISVLFKFDRAGIKSGSHVTQVLNVLTFNEESGKMKKVGKYFPLQLKVKCLKIIINFVVGWLILKGMLYTLKVLEGMTSDKKSPTLFRCNEKWRNERNLKHFKTRFYARERFNFEIFSIVISRFCRFLKSRTPSVDNIKQKSQFAPPY